MEDMAYLAGVIDGDGTITLHKHKQYGRATFQLRPRLIVSNTDLAFLRVIQKRHGGSIITHSPANGCRRASYLWRVFAIGKIRALLMGVRPFLLVKHTQAALLLAFLDSRIERGRAPYSDAEFALFEAIRAANSRGRHVA